MLVRGDVGEIAVVGVAAGHPHQSRLLRNRSDSCIRQLCADPVCEGASVGLHVGLIFFPVILTWDLAGQDVSITQPRLAASKKLSAKSLWRCDIGFSCAAALNDKGAVRMVKAH